MTSTLLFWFRIGIFLLIGYTMYTYARAALKKGYWLPKTSADIKDLAGDLLTIAGAVFVLWTLQNNFKKPMDRVLSSPQAIFPDQDFVGLQNGVSKKLSQYRGRLVLLNLWATWCPPCRREMPALDALEKKYADKGFTILALSDEDPTTVNDYLKDHPFSFTVGSYTVGNEAIAAIGTRPVSILISPEGKVLDMVVGARGSPFFEDWIEKHLQIAH